MSDVERAIEITKECTRARARNGHTEMTPGVVSESRSVCDRDVIPQEDVRPCRAYAHRVLRATRAGVAESKTRAKAGAAPKVKPPHQRKIRDRRQSVCRRPLQVLTVCTRKVDRLLSTRLDLERDDAHDLTCSAAGTAGCPQ